MATIVTVDFETFYDREFSLSKLTTEEYVRDPRFEVIGVGVAVGDAPVDWFSGTKQEVHDWLHSISWSDKMVLAHNAQFDAAIMAWHFDIKPQLWLDTLSMARPWFGTTTGVSLKALAEAFGIGQKGTEVVTAMGLRRKDFSPVQLAQYGEYCKNDVALTRELFKRMLPSFPSKAPNATLRQGGELMLIDQTIRMFTEPALELDVDMLREHLSSVRASKTEALRSALKAMATVAPDRVKAVVEARINGKSVRDEVQALLMSNPLFAAVLKDAGVEPPTKISLKTGKEAFAFAKTDKAFTDLLEHESPQVQALVAARLNTKSTIEESRTERFIAMAERGGMPIPLNYSGAFQTWRWSGADKLNLQNLPRGGTLRKAMRARKGEKVVAVDSSNIELRVNHTLAGQLSSVEAFKNGRDLYCEFASILFGRTITKADKNERQLGKLAHLSLGYGCGWEKFMGICRINKVILTPEEAERIVRLWRSTYAAIPKFWRAANDALDAIYAGREFSIGPSGLLLTNADGIQTPPAHQIRYSGLDKDEDNNWVYDNRRQRKKIYGGAVVENICQHVARNIIADQWLKASAWCKANAPGWRVILQVHDEIVLAGPEAHADMVNDTVVKIMSTSPNWWPEVPLAAEGGIGSAYGEAH